MVSGKYKLGERLGGGGMAEVFRATLVGAEGFARPVAIKRVLPGYSADEMFADMLKTEARIASMLTHPNIVAVFDFDRDDEDRLFLVMELVEGKNLYDVLLTGRVSMSIATFVIAELLRGLAFAHAMEHRGQPMFIVHRDVSPHNVLIAWSGAVKLSDFGIAKAAATTQVTRTGVVKGKVAYLSPEQALAKDLDGRSDLFAVGIMLHEMLTGARLFGVKSGAQDAVIVHRVLTLPISSPRLVDPTISAELEAVCMRLLERDRDQRFQTAEAALEALLLCPEISRRGELEMAELLAQRFPREAPPPGSWQSFAARTKPTPIARSSSMAPASAPSKMEYGGFSAVEDYEAPQKGSTVPLDDKTLLLASGGSFPQPRPIDAKTVAMYAVLGACAVVIAILGWRVYFLYVGPVETPLVEAIPPTPPPVIVRTATRAEEPAADPPPPTKIVIEEPPPSLTKKSRGPSKTKPAAVTPADAGIPAPIEHVLDPDLPDGDRVIKPEI
jgi:serine/threonine protein kinase